MSAPLPDDTEQQLRRYLQRQHRDDPTPAQTWQSVAARLAATSEGSPIMQNDTAHDSSPMPATLSERERMQRNANPPRRGFSAAGLAAVIVLALLARVVFTHGPANGSSSFHQVATVVQSSLEGISMTAVDDGWAVGLASTYPKMSDGTPMTPPTVSLIFHYTNGAWQKYPVPAGLAGSELHTVAMLNAHDGWAGGGYNEDPERYGGGPNAPTNKLAVLLHYDGSSWQSVAVPQTRDLMISHIAYDPTGDAWAVAGSANYTGNVAILHEHEGMWTVAHMGTYGGYIEGGSLSMVSATEGWAAIAHVPSVTSGPPTTTLLHLQNGIWSTAATFDNITFSSITLLSATDGWATANSLHQEQTTANGQTTVTSTNIALLYHYTHGTWTKITQRPTVGDSFYGAITFADKNHGWLPFSREISPDKSTSGLYAFDGTTWTDAHIAPKLAISIGSFSTPTDGWFVGYDSNGQGQINADGSVTLGIGYVFAHYHNGVWSEKPAAQ